MEEGQASLAGSKYVHVPYRYPTNLDSMMHTIKIRRIISDESELSVMVFAQMPTYVDPDGLTYSKL
jgi:hypothetical protein